MGREHSMNGKEEEEYLDYFVRKAGKKETIRKMIYVGR
jgi:hypothetical protein